MRTSVATAILIAAIALSAMAASLTIYAQAIGLTVSTDKTTYRPGEKVVVSGIAPANTPVAISTINPNGVEVDLQLVTSDS